MREDVAELVAHMSEVDGKYPRAPYQMAGFTINDKSGPGIVELTHLYGEFGAASKHSRWVGLGGIRAVVCDGRIIAAFPPIPSGDTLDDRDFVPMIVGGRKFYGGVVVIESNDISAEILYLREDGTLSNDPEPRHPTSRSLAITACVAALIALLGTSPTVDLIPRPPEGVEFGCALHGLYRHVHRYELYSQTTVETSRMYHLIREYAVYLGTEFVGEDFVAAWERILHTPMKLIDILRHVAPEGC